MALGCFEQFASTCGWFWEYGSNSEVVHYMVDYSDLTIYSPRLPENNIKCSITITGSLSLSIHPHRFLPFWFWHVCQVIIALKPQTHRHIVAKNALTKSDKTVVLLCLSLPGRLWNLKVYLRVRELFQILQLLSDTFQCLPPINSIHHSSMVSVLASCKHG